MQTKSKKIIAVLVAIAILASSVFTICKVVAENAIEVPKQYETATVAFDDKATFDADNFTVTYNVDNSKSITLRVGYVENEIFRSGKVDVDDEITFDSINNKIEFEVVDINKYCLHMDTVDSEIIAKAHENIVADDAEDTIIRFDENGNVAIFVLNELNEATIYFEKEAKDDDYEYEEPITGQGLNIQVFEGGKIIYTINDNDAVEVTGTAEGGKIFDNELVIPALRIPFVDDDELNIKIVPDDGKEIKTLSVKAGAEELFDAEMLEEAKVNEELDVTLLTIYSYLVTVTFKDVEPEQPEVNPEPEESPEPVIKDEIRIIGSAEGTVTGFELFLNDVRVGENTNVYYNNIVKGNTEADEKNIIKIIPAEGEEILEVTINNVKYTSDTLPEPQGENLNEYVFEVNGAEEYEIAVKAYVVPKFAQIEWANGAQDAEEYEEDEIFTNGTARVVKVLDTDENEVNLATENGVAVVEQNTNLCSVKVVEGAKVIFEIIPNYGYQLTDVKIGNEALIPELGINQYAYVVDGIGKMKFDATFTAVNDVVILETSKVLESTVELADNELKMGSAQLIVKDANLSADKIASFEAKAEEEEYEISSYLNVEFNQILYKGVETAENVWKIAMPDVNNDVQITLVLAEKLNATDVVIIREICDDGGVATGEFEVIEVDSYEDTTKTLKFTTKSFSNFAVAVKEIPEILPTPTPTPTGKPDGTVTEPAYIVELEEIIEAIKNGEDVITLTDEQAQAISNAIDAGIEMEAELDTREVDETEVTEDSIKIRNIIDPTTIVAGYYDVNLLVIDKESKTTITALTNLLRNVKLTVKISDELLSNVPSGYRRIFNLVRVHNGVAEVLATMDNGDGTISAETNKFSTYAIVYKDEYLGDADKPADDNNSNPGVDNPNDKDPINNPNNGSNTGSTQNPSNPSNGSQNTAVKNPQTGDNIIEFVVLFVLALTGMIIYIKRK